MKNSKKDKLKFIPLIVIIIIAIGLSIMVKASEGEITIDTILRYTPDNIYIAIVIILSLFALKSISVVFPLSVLYLASGILFRPFLSVLVSIVGLWITITIPYFIGYVYGKDINVYIKKKYPKIEKLEILQSENTFFVCFITRIVGFLPADILSIYFGICRISYRIYAIAGVSGSLLSIITTTLLGNQLKNPFSKEFVIILICRIGLVIFSIVINYIFSKKEKNIHV